MGIGYIELGTNHKNFYSVLGKRWLAVMQIEEVAWSLDCRVQIPKKWLISLLNEQKLNSVMDCKCCCAQKFFLLQFHWMLTTTTFATHHKIQLLLMNGL